MSSPARVRLLAIGTIDAPEMRPVCLAIESLRASGGFDVRFADSELAVRAAGDLSSAQVIDQDGWFPEIVVVCQSWPDEYAPEVAARSLSQWPLARWVCACGRWCESDGRTRATWPGAVRVSVDRAASRMAREIDVLRGRRLPLPLTASRDETFEFDFANCGDAAARGGLVAVWTADAEYFAMLSDVVRAAGHDVVRAGNVACAPTLVCDWEPWLAAPSEAMARWRRAWPLSRIVAMTSWYGPEIERRARELGADAVAAKLAEIESVCAVIGA